MAHWGPACWQYSLCLLTEADAKGHTETANTAMDESVITPVMTREPESAPSARRHLPAQSRWVMTRRKPSAKLRAKGILEVLRGAPVRRLDGSANLTSHHSLYHAQTQGS